MQDLTDYSRLSLNQVTTNRWSAPEAIDGCARAEVPSIALWRHRIAETGLESTRRLVRDAGLRVSGVCRGGMFPAATREERAKRIADNREAIDQAAELEASTLVLVCGAAPDRDLRAARRMVEDAIAELMPYAQERHVKLGIEPLHPMLAAERSCITSLEEANNLAEKFDAQTVGIVVDVYHVWWDAMLAREVQRARGRIQAFHICDWLNPPPDILLGRGMMGDGCIDIRYIRQLVEGAGYDGAIEVEIFNQAIWDRPGDEVLQLMKERYLECV